MALPSPLRPVAPGVHVVEAPQRFLGLALGARMTVLSLPGGLLVHSPLAVDPELLAPLGAPRWVLAPNRFHHLHAGPWAQAFETWGAPGLAAKRPDLKLAGELREAGMPFGDEVLALPLRCIPLTNEVVLLHRPSRTLVACDLVFNLPPTAPWITRAALRCVCAHPGCRVSLVERLAMRRAQARADLATILGWDFDRIIMAHGEIIETGGKAALRQAFRWLGDLE